MAVVKFGVGDSVRFIGTDNPVTVRQYNPETLEYRVQRGDDRASSQWASKLYLELTEPARRAGSGNELLHH
jgi:hypothetical protein